MVEACEAKRPRVIYPPFYDLAASVPRLASVVTAAFGPEPTDA